MVSRAGLVNVPVGTLAPAGQPFSPATGTDSSFGSGGSMMLSGLAGSLSGSAILGMPMHTFEGRPFQSEHEGGVQGFVPQRLTASVPAYQVSWLTTMSPSTLRSAPLSSR